MSQIFQKLKSLMMDMYESLTTCQGRTWMRSLLSRPGLVMDTAQKHQEEPDVEALNTGKPIEGTR